MRQRLDHRYGAPTVHKSLEESYHFRPMGDYAATREAPSPRLPRAGGGSNRTSQKLHFLSLVSLAHSKAGWSRPVRLSLSPAPKTRLAQLWRRAGKIIARPAREKACRYTYHNALGMIQIIGDALWSGRARKHPCRGPDLRPSCVSPTPQSLQSQNSPGSPQIRAIFQRDNLRRHF